MLKQAAMRHADIFPIHFANLLSVISFAPLVRCCIYSSQKKGGDVV
jgi:hypothetical protein